MNRGTLYVLAAALSWGTTGTAAALASGVGALAIGAAAMGVGGLLQALVALPEIGAPELGSPRTGRWWRCLRQRSRLPAGVLLLDAAGRSRDRHRRDDRFGTPRGGADRMVVRRPPAFASLGGRRRRRCVRGGVAGPGSARRGRWPWGRCIRRGGVGGARRRMYAVYTWGAARIMKGGTGSRPVMGTVFGLAGLLLIPALVVTGAPILASVQNLTVTAYLAVVPMFLGYVLFGAGLRTVSATSATTLSLIEPAAAAMIAMAILGERISAPGWIGVLLLFVSLACVAARCAALVDCAGTVAARDRIRRRRPVCRARQRSPRFDICQVAQRFPRGSCKSVPHRRACWRDRSRHRLRAAMSSSHQVDFVDERNSRRHRADDATDTGGIGRRRVGVRCSFVREPNGPW